MVSNNYNKWSNFLQPLDGKSLVYRECLSTDFACKLNLKETKKKGPGRPRKDETQFKDNDKFNPSSEWTLGMLASFIDFVDYVRKLELDDPSQVNINITEVMARQTSIRMHTDIRLEGDARMLIDSLLQTICKQYDVNLQAEVNYNTSHLPNTTFDYVLSRKFGGPLGCIEAKHPGSFAINSFAQAVVQLLCLQQMASKNGINVEKRPLFSVLTDSHKFIFIQLQGRELRLEHDQKKDMDLIKIRYLELGDAKSYNEILHFLKQLIEISLNNRKYSSFRQRSATF